METEIISERGGLEVHRILRYVNVQGWVDCATIAAPVVRRRAGGYIVIDAETKEHESGVTFSKNEALSWLERWA